MQPFTTLNTVAAPMPLANVDTDKIFPGRFLKTIRRQGLGIHLFHDLRYSVAGDERPDFILNQSPWRQAGILVALENFGCGSSREHAVWALANFGIRCLIAPDFADIFQANCFKNGLLPISLPKDKVEYLLKLAACEPHCRITVDLEQQTLLLSDQQRWHYRIPPDKRRALLIGEDEIARTMTHQLQIEEWENTSSEKA
ncbi:3-isopropylmalate dehydratase small subunit [Qipengyuania sp. NPDC077410]|uniref:3-isopropylmalate dehydratase small subunit n=1 Tax=Qipengyuania sp. NPDC077410 TaxID=3364496 RepID=UPI0037C7FF2F